MTDTILRIEDFTAEAHISGLMPADECNPANESLLRWVNEFCTKYEREFCRKFFPNAEDWERLRQYAEDERDDVESSNTYLSMLRFSLSRYVAFHLNRAQVNSAIGTVVLDGENGHRTDNRYLQCTLWNDMADNNCRLYSIMYPSLPVTQCGFELFSKINIYGI